MGLTNSGNYFLRVFIYVCKLGNCSFDCVNMWLPVQDNKGKFNFDQSTVINPETGEPVSLSKRASSKCGLKIQYGLEICATRSVPTTPLLS